MWRPLKHCGYWTLAKLMAYFSCHLPLETAWQIGDWLGKFAFQSASTSRDRARRQIQQRLTSVSEVPNVEQLVLKCFQNLGKNLMEFLLFQRSDWIDSAVSIKGRSHIDQALSQGRGAIILTGHFGNCELIGATLAHHGYQMSAIARQIRSEPLNTLVVETRQQAGYLSFDRDKSVRQAFRCLRRNELLAILADVDTETMGVFVDFFNRPAYTPAGPIVISQKTGAPLLPVFMVRQPDNTHLMIIEPALKLQVTGQKQQDLIGNTQRFTHIIETYIRRYPEQWIWMHDRWKTVQS